MGKPTKWPRVKLGDHVSLLTGFPFKSARFTRNPDDVPLVKGSNVHQGFIDWESDVRWPRDDAADYKEYLLKPNDVVLAMDRPWIEAGLKFAWIRSDDSDGLLVQRVARLRGANGLRSDFLRYVVGSPAFEEYIRPIVTGVNVPHISPQQIRDFQFCMPPEEVQASIASILAAYDTLIKNSLRRIKILEEMARSLYREWFVEFRFPGHDETRIVTLGGGTGPRGWKVAQIGSRFNVVLGGTPSRARPEFWNGNVPWINSSKINDLRVIEESELVTKAGLANSSAKMMPRRTTLIAITGATLGQVSLLEIEACANQSVVGIWDADDRLREFLYLAIKEEIHGLIGRASGGAQQHINKENVKEYQILLPPDDLVERFNNVARPIFDLIGNLLVRNKILRKTRDLLLPRFISGEIDVSTVKTETEAVTP